MDLGEDYMGGFAPSFTHAKRVKTTPILQGPFVNLSSSLWQVVERGECFMIATCDRWYDEQLMRQVRTGQLPRRAPALRVHPAVSTIELTLALLFAHSNSLHGADGVLAMIDNSPGVCEAMAWDARRLSECCREDQ